MYTNRFLKAYRTSGGTYIGPLQTILSTSPDAQKAIETELLELTGKPMNLKLKANDSSHNAENSEQEVPTSQRDMQRDASQDESVKLVLDVFDGRIVEVKP